MVDYASDSDLQWDELNFVASFFDVFDEGLIFVGLVSSGLVKSLLPWAGQLYYDY